MSGSTLWLIGFASLGLGLVFVAGGGLLGTELAPLARGYGLLVIAAAVYMLGGLALRDLLRRAARRVPATSKPTRAVSQR